MTGRRLRSLDLLRGLAVALMIIVNNPGNWLTVYPQLQHSAWNGWTLADLVFPFFIVIMGVALPFSLDRGRLAHVPPGVVHRRIVARAAVLIAIGVLLNAVIAWPHVLDARLPGVLQRIGITYAFAALAVVHLPARRQLGLAALLVVAHWVLFLVVPGGVMAGGGVPPGDNLAVWIDRAVFGSHLLSPTGDPEGLLGVLPSVATALAGAVAGHWIQVASDHKPVMLRLSVAGVLLVGLGLAWSLVWPINKNLWSGSFAVFATGVALLMLVFCYLIVDVPSGEARWTAPLQWLGTNALGIYIGSEFIGHLAERPLIRQGASIFSVKDVLFWRWVGPVLHDTAGHRASLVYALAYLTIWIVAAGLLRRGDIAIRA